jgi:hypothetical protein
MAESFNTNMSTEDDQAIEAFMTRLSAEPVTEGATLCDPEVLWWKAQLLRRWDAERKVHAPLDAMEPVQIVAGLVAAAMLLVWAVPSLVRVFSLIGV